MKVKIFEATYYIDLEDEINEFFRDNDIEMIEIKYSALSSEHNNYYSCLIVYDYKR